MKNNQLFPFSRNRYYSGKMLTSPDFQAEQAYFNNKRRFINSMVHGSGILCGLNVFSLDDLSVLVESGAAIDDFGREIVIPESVVKKLSAIPGFSQIKGRETLLCIRYQETPIQAVFAVNQQEKGDSYEYNRISEGYELFLKDEKEAAEGFQLEDSFFRKICLCKEQDFQIELTMPAAVCKGALVKVHLELEKLSEEPLPITWQGTLQMPAFRTEDGSHELQMGFEGLALEKGETAGKDYWVEAEYPQEGKTDLVFQAENENQLYQAGNGNQLSQAGNGNQLYQAGNGNQSFQVQIWEEHPAQLVMEEAARTNLEMLSLEQKKDYVVLAKLRLLHTDSAYLIDQVVERGVKQYICAPGWEGKRREYGSYFRENVPLPRGKEKKREETGGLPANAETRWDTPFLSTGILEIPLGTGARKGSICYSGEIMHGLGRGNVYVELGLECCGAETAPGANGAVLGKNAASGTSAVSGKNAVDGTSAVSGKNAVDGTSAVSGKSAVDGTSVIYGNAALFPRETEGMGYVELAVKVLGDKGSFIAAAKLLKNISAPLLTCRWVAVLFPSFQQAWEEEEGEGSIRADTPTVMLGIRESCYFHVSFHHMEPASLTYELTEPGSGTITPDGVYTAPGREGVYEIRIYCTDMPVICAYAYAVVRKKQDNENRQE